MLKKIFLAAILLVLTLSACGSPFDDNEPMLGGEPFELYLVADPQITGTQLQNYDLDELPLAEDPLIATDELVNYVWEFHAFDLTQDAYQKLIIAFSRGLPASGLPFVIVAYGERIFAGAFWSPISSVSYDGVTIIQPFDPSSQPLLITLGYPDASYFEGEDPRNDPRLESALDDAGVLRRAED